MNIIAMLLLQANKIARRSAASPARAGLRCEDHTLGRSPLFPLARWRANTNEKGEKANGSMNLS